MGIESIYAGTTYYFPCIGRFRLCTRHPELFSVGYLALVRNPYSLAAAGSRFGVQSTLATATLTCFLYLNST